MMTKKDFKLLAKAIKNSPIAEADKVAVVASLVVELKQTNPRFDAEKFMAMVTGKK